MVGVILMVSERRRTIAHSHIRPNAQFLPRSPGQSLDCDQSCECGMITTSAFHHHCSSASDGISASVWGSPHDTSRQSTAQSRASLNESFTRAEKQQAKVEEIEKEWGFKVGFMGISSILAYSPVECRHGCPHAEARKEDGRIKGKAATRRAAPRAAKD